MRETKGEDIWCYTLKFLCFYPSNTHATLLVYSQHRARNIWHKCRGGQLRSWRRFRSPRRFL